MVFLAEFLPVCSFLSCTFDVGNCMTWAGGGGACGDVDDIDVDNDIDTDGDFIGTALSSAGVLSPPFVPLSLLPFPRSGAGPPVPELRVLSHPAGPRSASKNRGIRQTGMKLRQARGNTSTHPEFQTRTEARMEAPRHAAHRVIWHRERRIGTPVLADSRPVRTG